ncbi:MAG TPA: FxLYD domain-containing protein [Candidatus Polarisedimenticolia bacterium]|nr:FxLYD domain-containing protein [Candidatus Polarisedimenticolia bacterium]
MIRKTLRLLAAALLIHAAAGSAAAAAIKSAKGPLVRHEKAAVTLKNAGIAITGYQLVRPTRLGRTNPFSDSGPALHLDVRNEGSEPRDFAIAVALFDKAGRLVGAAAEGHSGKLEPGEAAEVKVVFKEVNEEVPLATSVQVSLEIRR